MAAPSFTSKVVDDVGDCFSELSESCERCMTTMNKIKKKIEELNARPKGTIPTDKVDQWLSDLKSLEGQAAAIYENMITDTVSPNTIKIGLWGDKGAPNFDVGQIVSYITKVKVYTGNVVNGLEITYVDDEGNIRTYQTGSSDGGSNEFTLKNIENIVSVGGSFKVYDYATCISGLEFKTKSGIKYGPFGPGGGVKFNIRVVDCKIIGFFGQSDRYINSIGFYLGGMGNSVTATFK